MIGHARSLPAAPAALALLFVCIAFQPAQAQGAAALATSRSSATPAAAAVPGEGLSAEEIQRLMPRLDDADVRAILIARLQRDALRDEARKDDASSDLKRKVERMHEKARAVAAAAGLLPTVPGRIRASATADGSVGGGRLLIETLIALLVGWGLERAMRARTGAIGSDARPAGTATFGARVGMLLVRAVVDLLGIALFAVGAAATVLAISHGGTAAEHIFVELLTVIVATRIVALFSRVVLAPKVGWLRLLPMSDAAARALHGNIVLVAAVMFSMRRINASIKEFGLEPELVDLIAIITSGVFVGVIVALVWRWRAGLARMILDDPSGRAPSSLKRTVAGSCHVVAIVYVLGVWVVAFAVAWATGRNVFFPAIASLLVLLVLPAADLGMRALAKRWFGPREDAPATPAIPAPGGEASPADAAQAPPPAPGARPDADHSYEDAALGNMRLLLSIAVIGLLARIWEIDIAGLGESVVGAQAVAAIFDIGITVLLAYALWRVLEAVIERHVGAESAGGGAEAGEIGGAGASRLGTLLPLIRKFLMISLLVMVVLISLSSLGVDIGPLIAGAGVIGLAIGFGAQTLVKDVISGMFFLVDDAFRMGEYIEIDATRGAVEKISVRSMQLRHHNGPVHTIPFGDIRHITNYSRDWVVMKFELRLPFETDIDKVRKIIKKVGQELFEDPEHGPNMLQPLKSQGVNRMDDSAMIIRCKFAAKPGEQFVLRREAYTRIHKAFEENDIHFAPRRVIVEAATPEQAVLAAAAALDQEEDRPAAGGGPG